MIRGELAIESPVNPAFTMSCVVTPSSPRGAAQVQSSVPLHSFDRRRHVEKPPERKPGYGWENENLRQQRLSFPVAAARTYNTEQNRMIDKLVLKSKLRYGKISFESADLEFLSQEFCEIANDTAQVLLKTYKHIDERQLKIMSIASHKSQIVYVGDQGIEMADNDLLLFKTRVKNGMVSFHEDDIEARFPEDWQVPMYILEDLKRKASNGKLFIISDEKGNLRCTVKRTERVKEAAVAAVRDMVLAFWPSGLFDFEEIISGYNKLCLA